MAPVQIPLLERIVDLRQPSFWAALVMICFNPLMWNIVARRETKHKTLTRLLGSPKRGCLLLAAVIFSLGLVRDNAFDRALRYQPILPALGYGEFKVAAVFAFAWGLLLVVSSTYKLGIINTFLGDYFGILMDHKVESFPFNVVEHPMYYGSTICFYATAIWKRSPAGLLLATLMFLVYRIAMSFEGPYTNAIYEARERQRTIQDKRQ